MSWSRGSLRFLRGGICACKPWLRACRMMASLSQPLLAIRGSASIPSIRLAASAQSARVPSVAIIRTGIPNAPTAKCSFVLSPLWCASFLGFLPAHPLSAGEPCSDWRRSSAIRNPAHQSIAQAKIPTHPCRVSDKIAGASSSSPHRLEANRAMASLCSKSRTLH